MAKVVSSKFGDRGLVELPPINSGIRSAAPPVSSQYRYSYERTSRDYIAERLFSSKVPRKYSYDSNMAQTESSPKRWMGSASRPFTDNNLVTVKEVYRPGAEQLNPEQPFHYTSYEPVQQQYSPKAHFQQPIQESYSPQAQFQQPVQTHYSPQVQFQQPVQQYSPQAQFQQPLHQQYMPQGPIQQQYVPQATTGVQPEPNNQIVPYKGPPDANTNIPQATAFPSQQAPTAPDHSAQGHGDNSNVKHIFYGPDGKVIPGPPPGFPTPGSMPRRDGNNPNEKHIYYGPDGKVLPGPPTGVQGSGSMPGNDVYQRDFLVDAVLEFGRVKSVSNLDDTDEFPKLPDYLLRQLRQKYGQFERTDARILFKGGQFHVHGTPHMIGADPLVQLPPPFEHLSERHHYGSPMNRHIERSYSYDDY